MAYWSIEAEASAFEAKGIANGEQGYGEPPECIGCSTVCDMCPECEPEHEPECDCQEPYEEAA